MEEYIEIDECVYDILYLYDVVDSEKKGKIEDFFSKHGINNGQDTDDVLKDVENSNMTLSECKEFITSLKPIYG